jgi:CRP/FNR family transcriptional regulator, cyclic AMP receptor protein
MTTRNSFKPKDFLAKVGVGRTFTNYRKKDTIYSQGDRSDAVLYIQKGRVELSVVSKRGKVATIAILSAGDFFGEGCLIGQSQRIESATVLTDCEVLKITKTTMMRTLQRHHSFSQLFVTHLLSRNIRYQEDLVDQLFNSSEKRLARILLILTRFGKEGESHLVTPKISQETLAQIIGTTRERVSHFMNKFRKLGFIDYNGGLQVHSSLLNVVLHD